MASSSRAPKHVWTKEEEATLVDCIVELVSAGGWKSNNGTFWSGYLAQLHLMMAVKLLGCNVQATTVIDGCIKALKRSYQTIVEITARSVAGSVGMTMWSASLLRRNWLTNGLRYVESRIVHWYNFYFNMK